jgi:hypothetical protein
MPIKTTKITVNSTQGTKGAGIRKIIIPLKDMTYTKSYNRIIMFFKLKLNDATLSWLPWLEEGSHVMLTCIT